MSSPVWGLWKRDPGQGPSLALYLRDLKKLPWWFNIGLAPWSILEVGQGRSLSPMCFERPWKLRPMPSRMQKKSLASLYVCIATDVWNSNIAEQFRNRSIMGLLLPWGFNTGHQKIQDFTVSPNLKRERKNNPLQHFRPCPTPAYREPLFGFSVALE